MDGPGEMGERQRMKQEYKLLKGEEETFGRLLRNRGTKVVRLKGRKKCVKSHETIGRVEVRETGRDGGEDSKGMAGGGPLGIEMFGI